MQDQIDAWHKARRNQSHDAAAYKAFLEEIGYLLPEGQISRSRPPMSTRNRQRSPARNWWCRSQMPDLL
jgi:hypothetical protein